MNDGKRNSISVQYKRAYYSIFICVIIMFIAASAGNFMLSRGYRSALDELLELNQFFVEIDTSTMIINDAYLYLRENSIGNYAAMKEQIRQQTRIVNRQVIREYSRAKKDLICMTETYLEECDRLIFLLESYLSKDNPEKVDYAEIDSQYQRTQEIINYINSSFREIYSLELVATQEREQKMTRLSRLISLLQVVFLLLILIIYRKYNLKVIRNISDRLNQLIQFVEHIKGNLYHGERLKMESQDELSLLADTINDMLDIILEQVAQLEQDNQIREQIREMEIDNLRLKNELQSSQMDLLQSRINPHFLFNTLNMISNQAVLEDAEQTRILIDITAEYLRYNLDQLTKTVTLQQELANLKDYIYIQQCRFGDRFVFTFDLDERCAQQEMPCMILQPLVENALKHGIHNMLSGGVVTIRTMWKETSTVMEIEDNGCGFPEEYLLKMQSGEFEYEKDNHVGIRNIYMRLKFFYTDKIYFRVDSRPGRTVLHMEVPCSTL